MPVFTTRSVDEIDQTLNRYFASLYGQVGTGTSKTGEATGDTLLMRDLREKADRDNGDDSPGEWRYLFLPYQDTPNKAFVGILRYRYTGESVTTHDENLTGGGGESKAEKAVERGTKIGKMGKNRQDQGDEAGDEPVTDTGRRQDDKLDVERGRGIHSQYELQFFDANFGSTSFETMATEKSLGDVRTLRFQEAREKGRKIKELSEVIKDGDPGPAR